MLESRDDGSGIWTVSLTMPGSSDRLAAAFALRATYNEPTLKAGGGQMP
jgi:hypothetical protein